LAAECPSSTHPRKRYALLTSGDLCNTSSFIYYYSLFPPRRGTVHCLRLGFLGNSLWNGDNCVRTWLEITLGMGPHGRQGRRKGEKDDPMLSPKR
jgi:hypothetical protein